MKIISLSMKKYLPLLFLISIIILVILNGLKIKEFVAQSQASIVMIFQFIQLNVKVKMCNNL